MDGRIGLPQGLCSTCIHARMITSAKKSVFLLCRLSSADPRFPRYPRLPVLTCAGYNQAIGLGGEKKT